MIFAFLTPQETEAIRFIKRCTRETGASPSYRAIGTALEIRSLGTVHSIITTLEAKGYVLKAAQGKRVLPTQRAYRNPCLVEFHDEVWRSLVSYARAERIAPETAAAEFVRAGLGCAA